MTNEDMTYDEALQRLETLVTQLERGGKNLDETLAMFKEGTALLKRCQAELTEVEGRLAELKLEDAEALVKDED